MLQASDEAEDFMKDLKNHDPVKANILPWDDDKYFSDKEYVTNSQLKKLTEGGPQHLQSYFDFGMEQKKHFDFGSALHCLVLEPDMFDSRYYAVDDTEICIEASGPNWKAENKNPKATKIYKKWIKEILINNASRTQLEMSEMDSLMAMVRKLESIPEVMSLLKGTQREVVYWDTIDGVKVKCKADIKKNGDYAADLKSMADAPTENNFTREMHKRNYDQQGAFYKKILKVDRFIFIAIEKKYPYTVGIFELGENSEERGIEKYMKCLKEFKFFFKENKEEINKFYYKAII